MNQSRLPGAVDRTRRKSTKNRTAKATKLAKKTKTIIEPQRTVKSGRAARV
jgi:hypothetical protein